MQKNIFHSNQRGGEEDSEEFEENSFENGNEIFELRSQVNSLRIER